MLSMSYKDTTPMILTDDHLYNRAMALEIKLNSFVRSDTYFGKGSRVFNLFEECNNLWKEISRRARLKKKFKVAPKIKQRNNPYS